MLKAFAGPRGWNIGGSYSGHLVAAALAVVPGKECGNVSFRVAATLVSVLFSQVSRT